MPVKIPAYKGTEPYIFVSYSHKNDVEVMKDIDWMVSQGYRVWYDEGIEFGVDFPAELARALKNCSQFVVYFSESAVASEYVNREIVFALNNKKKILPVFLTEVQLSDTLSFMMGTLNYLERYKHEWSEFCLYLERGLNKACRNSQNATVTKPESNVEGHNKNNSAPSPSFASAHKGADSPVEEGLLRLEIMKTKMQKIDYSMSFCIDKTLAEIHECINTHVDDLENSIPDWIKQYEFKTKVNIFSINSVVKATNELADAVGKKMTDIHLNWLNSTIEPLLQAKAKDMMVLIDEDIKEFMIYADAIRKVGSDPREPSRVELMEGLTLHKNNPNSFINASMIGAQTGMVSILAMSAASMGIIGLALGASVLLQEKPARNIKREIEKHVLKKIDELFKELHEKLPADAQQKFNAIKQNVISTLKGELNAIKIHDE